MPTIRLEQNLNMTSALIFAFLLGFLATSVNVPTALGYHLKIHQLDIQESSGNETGKDLQHFGKEDEEQLPGICWACKWLVKKVKNAPPRDNSAKQNEVKNKLFQVCNKIGFLKSMCKKFVTKTIDILVEELSTTDNPKTVCINVKACRSKSTVEDLVWDAVETLEHSNIF